MSAEWKSGQVAMVSGTEGTRRAVRRGGVWINLDSEGYVIDAYVENARPLVVIDPEDREAVERLLLAYGVVNSPGNLSRCIPNMQDALREFANPTPPKPDEPTGLGAVVEDEGGRRFVRVGPTIGNFYWRSTEAGNSDCFPWRTVKAVRVLSEGVR